MIRIGSSRISSVGARFLRRTYAVKLVVQHRPFNVSPSSTEPSDRRRDCRHLCSYLQKPSRFVGSSKQPFERSLFDPRIALRTKDLSDKV